jgi:MFS family permease
MHVVRSPDQPCADYLGQSTLRLDRLAVPREIAFWLIAYVLAVTQLGTSLPAPLYAIYQRQWHFSAGILTLVFAVYAVAVLVTLLLAGRTSDQVGRKPIMAAAVGFSMLSTVVFILANGVGWLYLGRILSGVSAGLITGASAAALTEMVEATAARRASLVAVAATTGGAGLGPLMGGLFAQYLPRPTVLVFEAYLGLLVIAALAAAVVPETVTRRERLSLRFTGLGIPEVGRNEFIAAGLAAFASYALTGLFTSVAPSFTDSMLHKTNYAVAGGVAFLVFAAATVAAVGVARFNSRPVVLVGLGLFLPGLALVVAGMAASSLALFLGGAVVGGFAVGAMNVGSLSTANRLAGEEDRARVLSTYFVFAYSGLIIPVVGVGVASDFVGDFRAVLGCSIVLAALCVLAAVTTAGGGDRLAPVRGRAARSPASHRAR